MNFSEVELKSIIESVINKIIPKKYNKVPVGVSNRHLHLCQKDLDILFGKNYTLTKLKDLKQPGQYAAQEAVTIVGPKGSISNVRILGPVRKSTQIEISRTDSFALGLDVPVRISGNTKNTPGAIIVGPNDSVKINEGVIIAANHLHISPEEAKAFNLIDGQTITVRNVNKSRNIYYVDVVVRSGPAHLLEFHIDTDEANAGMLNNNDLVEIVY